MLLDPISGRHFLLLMADHVMTPGMISALAEQTTPEDGAILAVDFDLEGVFDMDDATTSTTAFPYLATP